MTKTISLATLLVLSLSATAFANTPGAGAAKPNKGALNAMRHDPKVKFERADANRDGKVSRAEAEAEAPRMAVMFDALDANRDGVLVLGELEAFHGKMKAAHEQAAVARFNRLDTNRDGALTAAELTAGRPQGKRGQAGVRGLKLDINADGKVTLDEFKAARGKHGPHGQRGRMHRGGPDGAAGRGAR